MFEKLLIKISEKWLIPQPLTSCSYDRNSSQRTPRGHWEKGAKEEDESKAYTSKTLPYNDLIVRKKAEKNWNKKAEPHNLCEALQENMAYLFLFLNNNFLRSPERLTLLVDASDTNDVGAAR